ncbi:MAG: antitoxin Xre/MbcA/ParS toxin-binding domain-containing protein [Roseovarius sp.]
MINEPEYEALMRLIERTYRNDAEAISRFLERPHKLLNGRAPRDVMDSGTKGVNDVRTMVERANSGMSI